MCVIAVCTTYTHKCSISAFANSTMVRKTKLINTQYGNLSVVLTNTSTITVSEVQC